MTSTPNQSERQGLKEIFHLLRTHPEWGVYKDPDLLAALNYLNQIMIKDN